MRAAPDLSGPGAAKSVGALPPLSLEETPQSQGGDNMAGYAKSAGALPPLGIEARSQHGFATSMSMQSMCSSDSIQSEEMTLTLPATPNSSAGHSPRRRPVRTGVVAGSKLQQVAGDARSQNCPATTMSMQSMGSSDSIQSEEDDSPGSPTDMTPSSSAPVARTQVTVTLPAPPSSRRRPARAGVVAGAKLQQAIQDIREAAQQGNWQVYYESNLIQAQDISAILVPVAVEKDIPKDLLSWLAHHAASDSAVWAEDAAAPAPAPRAPVIGVLFNIEEVQDEDTLIMRAQQELLDGGADAAVVKPSSVRELRLSIRAAVGQVYATRELVKRSENDLRQRVAPHIRQLKDVAAEQQAATGQANEAAREAMGMFWHASHVLFRGFPQLNMELPATPRQGEMVGPLRLHGQLGHGTFGTVVAAVDEETEEKEALKVIVKENITDVVRSRRVWKEISFLQLLKHDNIIACFGALQGPAHIFIRMELVGGGNLYRALKQAGDRFDVVDAQRCQAQLASAVEYCHGMRVAHCDLKPENIGLCPGRPLTLKVLDLGSARRTDSDCYRAVGTIPFMAPEVLEASVAIPFQPAGSDVFACGVILLEMLCGIGKLNDALGWAVNVRPSPQLGAELRDLLQDTAGMAAALEEDVGDVPVELHRLVAGIVRSDPARRWTAAKALRSPWLQQGLASE